MLFAEFIFPESTFLNSLEYLFGAFFLVELILALKKAKVKWKFLISPLAIIDIATIGIILYRGLVSDSDILHIISSLRILRAYIVFYNLPKFGFLIKNSSKKTEKKKHCHSEWSANGTVAIEILRLSGRQVFVYHRYFF